MPGLPPRQGPGGGRTLTRARSRPIQCQNLTKPDVLREIAFADIDIVRVAVTPLPVMAELVGFAFLKVTHCRSRALEPAGRTGAGCKGSLTHEQMSSYLYTMRNRVKEQRALRGLSQADIAAALGVSRQTVISIESGRYLPSLPLAFRIARFFDVPVEKMFDPDDEEAGT